MNTPIFLTLIRILVIPVIMVIYFFPASWAHPVSAILFTLAAITDWLDGYLARSMQLVTKIGAFLDPVADKLLVATVLVLVISAYHMSYLAIPAAIIIGREIAISALREWMAEIGKRTSVAVSFIGKVKTAVQLVALILLLWWQPDAQTWILVLGAVFLYIAAVLTLWSMVVYLKLAWPNLVQK